MVAACKLEEIKVVVEGMVSCSGELVEVVAACKLEEMKVVICDDMEKEDVVVEAMVACSGEWVEVMGTCKLEEMKVVICDGMEEDEVEAMEARGGGLVEVVVVIYGGKEVEAMEARGQVVVIYSGKEAKEVVSCVDKGGDDGAPLEDGHGRMLVPEGANLER
ncbi:hypothetical protein B296_00044651 [Ensete ventricosum]|uniref:Uncharacterized protein n=1 Tax=Ensete ventricosum TaxID=4639 RepID=A0A426X8B3_ENSVE|nr:hypothetical protein B296_00044651 [Ensete ventricosum]